MLFRCVALPLLVLLAQVMPASAQGRPEQLGRWGERPSRCLRSWAGAKPGSCVSVMLDQRSAGVMRVVLMAPAEPPLAFNQLSFVGQLQQGSQPMSCRQGGCSLSQPIVLSLSSVSQAEFDPRGLARSLPSAWPVTGQCQLRPERISCEAKALSGEFWTAEAQSHDR